MNPNESNVLHVIHVAGALMLVGFTFFAFAAAPERKKWTMIWGGIAALIVLLTGVRMWQGMFNFAVAGWIVVKIVCWLAISALSGIGFRRRGSPGTLATITIVLAAIAVAMAYLKPF